MDYTASSVYAFAGSAQPTASPVPDHAPGPEPVGRTVAMPKGILANPALLVVAMLGLAALLVNFSVSFKLEG